MTDEEKKAIEIVKGITEDDLLNYWEGAEEPYNAIQTILNLIEKQSKEIEEYKKQLDLDNECEIALNSKVMDLEKEIEELKEKNKTQSDCAEPIERTEEMVNMRWVNHNYILKTESEQRERRAYIKGTNNADKLCNKKWEDKIKAKIEEVHYKMIGHQDLREAVKQVLNSLLEKE